MRDDVVQGLVASPDVRRLLASPQTGVNIVDQEGDILWASPSMLQATGHHARRAFLVLTLLLFAGCATPDEGTKFRLSGSFTAERIQADLDEFHAIVRPYSDDVAILESFPEPFSIRGIVGGCEQLRATLETKDYIASVGTCTVESDTGDDGDNPVSSP